MAGSPWEASRLALGYYQECSDKDLGGLVGGLALESQSRGSKMSNGGEIVKQSYIEFITNLSLCGNIGRVNAFSNC